MASRSAHRFQLSFLATSTAVLFGACSTAPPPAAANPMIVQYAELSAKTKKDGAACDRFIAQMKLTASEKPEDRRPHDLALLLESWPTDPHSLNELRNLVLSADPNAFDLESTADFNELNLACALETREQSYLDLIKPARTTTLAPEEQRGLRDAFFVQSLEQDDHSGSIRESISQVVILRAFAQATWISPKFGPRIEIIRIQAENLRAALEAKQNAIVAADSARPFVDHIRYELTEGLKIRKSLADLIRKIQSSTPVIHHQENR